MAFILEPKGTETLRNSPYAKATFGLFTNPRITPVVEAAAYSAGDVIFDTTEIPNATQIGGGAVKLTSLTLLDKVDATAAAITLHFFSSNVSLGTKNAAPDISDANMLNHIGSVTIASGDFVDVGASKVATLKEAALGLILKPANGTSLWVAATCAGTPTQGAVNDFSLTFGFQQ